ncbi:MAG: NAD-dependent epimerase [Balneolaceae bacterium]
MKKILVTGAAGFIGFHLSKKLLSKGYRVIGLDNLNSYYSTELKRDRLEELDYESGFSFKKIDIADSSAMKNLFLVNDFATVYHMAAQAGVRYSLDHPEEYINSNLVGFANLLECCRDHHIRHLIYASSSSVYGLNTKQPYSVHETAEHPVSLYAATKKANELMAHAYSQLYDLPTTGLRFFTVYGPWGRPDMAYFKFVKKIMEGDEIDIYNKGEMARDFTYIDDIVESLYRLMNVIPTPNPDWNSDAPDPGSSSAPYRLYNIGNNSPVHLMEFINIIQEEVGKKAKMNFLPMQPGDVHKTWADSSDLYKAINYSPSTTLQEGIRSFVSWYKEYHPVESEVLTA